MVMRAALEKRVAEITDEEVDSLIAQVKKDDQMSKAYFRFLVTNR